MKLDETKNEILKVLVNKLTDIAEKAVKSIDANAAGTAGGETGSEAKPADKPDVNKQLTDLTNKITELEKKLAAGIPDSKEELEKKQSEILAGVSSLIKSMNLNPEDLDVNFVIKEKKKGTVENTNTKFSKSGDAEGENDDAEGESDLEKELSKLSPEERQEALNEYFKAVVLK